MMIGGRTLSSTQTRRASGRMGQTPNERLRDYLAQLPPQSQALLMREFERAIERGEDAAVATFVLEELRKIVRGTDEPTQPRTDDPARLLFRPLEPFLIDGNFPRRPGQIRRAALQPIWQWLVRDGAPDPARDFEAALNAARDTEKSAALEAAVRTFQRAAAEAIGQLLAGGDRRLLARVGGPDVLEDLQPIGAVLQAREAMETLDGRLPRHFRMFAEAQVGTVGRRAKRSRAADAAAIAVCIVAGDGAVVRAMANHPPGDQDSGIRR